MQESLASAIVTKLKAAKQVLLVMHRHPDPDSLGSAAAFGAFLEAQEIPYQYFCSTTLPKEAVMFGIDERDIWRPDLRSDRGTVSSFDVVCTFDAGDPVHAGLEELITPPLSSPYLKGRMGGVTPFLIVFDHHSTNTHFGDLNVIDPICASTTELIYRFFQAAKFPISAKVAAYLLAGLLTDTDNFLNPATSARALQMAGELLARGVTLPALRALLFERRNLAHLPLIGEILTRLRKNPRYGLVFTYLTEEDLRRFNASLAALDGVANLLNCVGEAQAMLLIKAEAGQIKVSLRTTAEDVNVGRLAELLGGGGHRKAAGFTLRGSLQVEGERVRIL